MKKVLFVLVVFVTWILCQYFFKSCRFDLVNGQHKQPSSSADKDEAIERGVYIADVCFVEKSVAGILLNQHEGWIEKSWHGGVWYWTTNVDIGTGYSIRIVSPGNAEAKRNLIMRNGKSSGRGFEGIGYAFDTFGGHLGSFPTEDTLEYMVLKRNIIDFTPENIIGTVKIVIDK